MTLIKTTTPDRLPVVPEALFPRDGFVHTPHGTKPIFLGHPNATCDICERRFSRHEPWDLDPTLVVICGGHLMRLTTRKTP